MAQASDYPITFGYGATDDVYYGPKAVGKPTYIGVYHRGDDRAMPFGTSVVVNGVQIGLSGNGNGRYGAHLHIGKFVNGSDVNPNGGGFSLDGAKVITVVDSYATDPVNGKYVRIQDASGAQWVYLHMSAINVKVGQELKGSTMDTLINDGDVYYIAALAGLTQQNIRDLGLVGKTWKEGMTFLGQQPIFTDNGLGAQVQNLKAERDGVLYPFVETVKAVAGLPNDFDPRKLQTLADAITALKKGGVSSVVINGTEYVPKK